jgi:hypothetical protein
VESNHSLQTIAGAGNHLRLPWRIHPALIQPPTLWERLASGDSW